MKLAIFFLLAALVASAVAESSWRLRNAHALTLDKDDVGQIQKVCEKNSDCIKICLNMCSRQPVIAVLCNQGSCYCKLKNYYN